VTVLAEVYYVIVIYLNVKIRRVVDRYPNAAVYSAESVSAGWG